MKKSVSLFLIISLAICLFSCGNSSNSSNSTSKGNQTQSSNSAVNKEEPETKKVISSVAEKNQTDTKTSIPVTLKLESCEKSNGFNPNYSGSDNDLKSHGAFDRMFSVTVLGVQKQSDGTYVSKDGKSIIFSVELLQKPSSLKVNSAAGWWNWYGNTLNNCTYNGSVYGTDISGETIGRGAYYIEIAYKDGTTETTHKCNFTNSMEKNTVNNITVTIDPAKELEQASIVMLYQIKYEYYTNFMWYTGYSDWRESGVAVFAAD